MSARSGGEIARLPLGEAAAFRAGAPYWVVHRADLQAALQAQVNDNPDIDLRLGCQFEDVVTHAKGLTVVQRSGMTRQQELALALIGADGIWSAVRHHLFPEVQPQFSGLIAWRGTLDATQLPREYTSRACSSGWEPNAHLVAYPISGGAPDQCRRHRAGHLEQAGLERARRCDRNQERVHATAMAGAGADDDRRRRWLAQMGAVHRCPMAATGAAARSRCSATPRTPCCRLPPKARAWRSRMPRCWRNAWRGAGENAAAIRGGAEALRRLRRARVARVQRTARRNGRIYHLSGAAALARDLFIRAIGPQRMLARQDWIYDWRA